VEEEEEKEEEKEESEGSLLLGKEGRSRGEGKRGGAGRRLLRGDMQKTIHPNSTWWVHETAMTEMHHLDEAKSFL